MIGAPLSRERAGNAPPVTEAPTQRLRLVLLGSMEAYAPGSLNVLPRSRKARAILAILGLSVGTEIRRARFGQLLWSQRAEEQQRGSLRQALHELTDALHPPGMPESEPLLITSRETLALRSEHVWVDAGEVLRNEAARPEILDLMRGELLEDLERLDPAFDGWLAGKRRELRAAAARQAGLLLEAARDPVAQVAAARRLLEIESGAEHGWQGLIRGLAALDDRTGALDAYEACRAALAERFRAQPSAVTQALVEELRASAAFAKEPAPPPSMPAPPAIARSARGARLGVMPLVPRGDGIAPHLPVSLAEEITAALARFRWLCVVDSASLATMAERGIEAALAEHRLDFLLTGTIQRGAGPIRTTLQLQQLAPEPMVVWAQRFDRDAGDLLAMQDEVAAEVVAQIDPEILLIEAGRASARATLDASAYDLLLQAIPAIHRLQRAEFLAAGDLLRRAIAAEPHYAPAHAWAAYWHLFLVGQGWATEDDAAVAEAERLARQAITLDPLDAQAHTILGHVKAFLHHEVEEAAALHQRALTLNPNLAMAWVFSGMALSYQGLHDSALARLDRYRRLAPSHPHAFFFDAARGIPLLCSQRHAEAVRVGREASALRPEFSYPYKTYLSALGHLGRMDEAAQIRARLQAIEPDFDLDKALRRTPLRRLVDRAHYERGLVLAGLT